jgi:hypothetical protein
MDPISLIVAAIAAGASAALKDTASSAAKDAYETLKELLRRKLSGDRRLDSALEEYERSPDPARAPVTADLEAARAGEDEAIVRAAQALLALTDPSGARAGKYNVTITGGKAITVGDYATVFQVFASSSPALASFMRTSEFRTLVDERTRRFVGRDFVFTAVDRVLAQQEFPSGYVLIRGEPGIGKTAIAAQLVKSRGCVHHFNIALQNIRSARDFLHNVCAQLIVRYGLDHTALPPGAGEDSGFLSQLLQEAVERARAQGALPVVVVVDAIDEAEDNGLARSANRLYLPHVLPPGAFFVLTTREQIDYRLDVDHLTNIWIRDNDPENQRDVTRYVETFIDEHREAMTARIAAWGITREAFAREITQLSEGNFMYLVYVLPEIKRGRLSREVVGDVSALPHGLQGYYRRHWRDMKAADVERFEREQRPVLCFLAISREPVSRSLLADWTRLEPSGIDRVIGEWREFLNEDPREDGDARYRIYHPSFAEFLEAEENLRWYHERIVEAALRTIDFPGEG